MQNPDSDTHPTVTPAVIAARTGAASGQSSAELAQEITAVKEQLAAAQLQEKPAVYAEAYKKLLAHLEQGD